MTYSDVLRRLPKNERHRARAAAHVVEGEKLARTFDTDGLTVTVESGPTLREMNGKALLEVTVSATRDGKTIAIDNPLQFLNPPMQHGGVEDVAGAYRRIIADAVLYNEQRA